MINWKALRMEPRAEYVIAIWDDEDTSGQPNPLFALPCGNAQEAEWMREFFTDLIGTLKVKPYWSVTTFPLSHVDTPSEADKLAEEFFKMSRGEGYEP